MADDLSKVQKTLQLARRTQTAEWRLIAIVNCILNRIIQVQLLYNSLYMYISIWMPGPPKTYSIHPWVVELVPQHHHGEHTLKLDNTCNRV